MMETMNPEWGLDYIFRPKSSKGMEEKLGLKARLGKVILFGLQYKKDNGR